MIPAVNASTNVLLRGAALLVVGAGLRLLVAVAEVNIPHVRTTAGIVNMIAGTVVTVPGVLRIGKMTYGSIQWLRVY